MSDRTFSLLHRGVQEAVWKLRWTEFKPVQVDCIHAICETRNHVIVCAPTAGGKTEAAFLPILSCLLNSPEPSVQALYVGPLKALINDQFSRLEILCEELEIPVHRWHGDVSAGKKKALRDKPGGILLITPESLESNFINFGSQVSRIYRHLSFVVVDELHSFIGGVRGLHLQSLLSRLTSAAGCSPRLVGLSATLSDPMAARTFLVPDAPGDVRLVEDNSAKREIRFGIRAFLKPPAQRKGAQRLSAEQALTLVDDLSSNAITGNRADSEFDAPRLGSVLQSSSDDEDELDEVVDDIIRHFRLSTNLIFGNSKQCIETLADRIRKRVLREGWSTDPFVVHHGSLSKDLREDAEAKLKSGVPTTALCSSTLEMGIDIGYVTAVGQLDTPWSVSSLIQRLGRSGRRPGEPAIMRMYVRENSPDYGSSLTDLLYPDLLRAIAITQLMLAKWLEPADLQGMHLSTLTHQILSFLKQTGGMRVANLFRSLCEMGPFRNVSQQQFGVLLRGLAASDLIEQVPTGEIVLAMAGEHHTAAYDFYASFKSTEEYIIRTSSDEIGRLPADIIPPVGEHLLLAGNTWVVVDIHPDQKFVVVSLSPGGKVPPFQGGSAEVHSRVVSEMKSILTGDGEPAYLDHNGKLLLRAARRTAYSVQLNRHDVVVGRQSIQWFPWVGSRTLQTLALMAKSENIRCEIDRLSLTFQLASLDLFLDYLRSVSNSKRSAIDLASLLPVKSIEKFDDFIPESLLDESNAKRRLNIEEARHVGVATLIRLTTFSGAFAQKSGLISNLGSSNA